MTDDPTFLSIPRHIQELALYVPGKLIEDVLEEAGLDSAVKLASNENSLGPSPLALAAAAQALAGAARYGDADSRRFRQAVARRLGVSAAGVLAGNGSSEFILILAHALAGPGRSALMSRPSFSLYAKNVQAAGGRAVEIPATAGHGHDLEAMLRAADETVSLVFLDNPLNPTGAYIPPDQLLDFAERLPKTALLALDEAYVDFCRAPRPDYARLLSSRPAIILRTFSKLHGLAGLRAAYALAAPALIQALNKVRQPFNLNSLAQAAALAALDDTEHVEKTLDMTWRALDFLTQKLPELGLTVHPTQANFVMVGLPEPLTADETAQALLREGVIIRSLTSFGLPRHLRINAGLPKELELLLTAFRKVLRA
jgi:histidinol-phosphate aminotransferase